MARSYLPHFFLSLFTGFFAWFAAEVSLRLFRFAELSTFPISSLVGGATGAALGFSLLGVGGLLAGSVDRFKKGSFYGTLAGGTAGFMAGALIEIAVGKISGLQDSLLLQNALFVQKWLAICVAVGLVYGLRDQKKLLFTRGFIAGAASGLLGGIVAALAASLLPAPFWARGIGLLAIAISMTAAFFLLAQRERKHWLRGLNGRMTDIEFELTEPYHFFGPDPKDDIALDGYRHVSGVHAKLIRDEDGEYTMLDNDPFGRTYVNFRSIEEQPLKNGDILKVGEALLQYCTRRPKKTSKQA